MLEKDKIKKEKEYALVRLITQFKNAISVIIIRIFFFGLNWL